ncbi:hypothetical protein [Methanolobus sp. WCC4]|uniref:hypothetical protein n=1 Tax=Methanolobus sp. WCC4 TaxID=3125784 RepID=UPI0030F5FCB7
MVVYFNYDGNKIEHMDIISRSLTDYGYTVISESLDTAEHLCTAGIFCIEGCTKDGKVSYLPIKEMLHSSIRYEMTTFVAVKNLILYNYIKNDPNILAVTNKKSLCHILKLEFVQLMLNLLEEKLLEEKYKDLSARTTLRGVHAKMILDESESIYKSCNTSLLADSF